VSADLFICSALWLHTQVVAVGSEMKWLGECAIGTRQSLPFKDLQPDLDALDADGSWIVGGAWKELVREPLPQVVSIIHVQHANSPNADCLLKPDE